MDIKRISNLSPPELLEQQPEQSAKETGPAGIGQIKDTLEPHRANDFNPDQPAIAPEQLIFSDHMPKIDTIDPAAGNSKPAFEERGHVTTVHNLLKPGKPDSK